MKATFNGYQSLTYMGFFDNETGRTLVCEPGVTYDISPDVPEDGRFTFNEVKKTESKKTDPSTDSEES